MGLFSANYAKEGPGVSKNAPQKKRFFLFWEIYFRKFWKLVQLNLIYVLFFIPGIIGLFYYLTGGPNILSILLILVSVVLVGPANAGLTYVLRNFTREEHAFVFSDFKDNLLSNFKQAAIYNSLFCLAIFLCSVATVFYYQNVSKNSFFYIPLIMSMACIMIMLFMNFYMYTMIVTFRLSLLQMLKNALIFAIIGVFTNILTLLIVAAVSVLLYLFFPFTVLVMIPIAFSTIWFIITFNAYPKIKKLMIDPITEKEQPEEEEVPEEERVFSDERILPRGDDDGEK